MKLNKKNIKNDLGILCGITAFLIILILLVLCLIKFTLITCSMIIFLLVISIITNEFLLIWKRYIIEEKK